MGKTIKVTEIKANPNNPRIIRDDKFRKMVESITSFPEMMVKRPMVCVTDEDGRIFPLGGNQRLKAIQEIGMNEIPAEWVMMADDWTPEQRREFVVKDNLTYGEHDFEMLRTDYDVIELQKWGMDIEEENETKAKIQEAEIEPYIRTHVLLSFPPERMIDLQPLLQQICAFSFVEYEQSNN